MSLPPGFQPTPFQAGHAIGAAVSGRLIRHFSEAPDQELLDKAGLSRARLADELQLLALAAAFHAIESSGLPARAENEVAAGLFQWIREQPAPGIDYFLAEVYELTDTYAQARRADMEDEPGPLDLSAIEEVFGERLLALGEDIETRGLACARICQIGPRVLWPAKYRTTMAMLADAWLVPLAS